MKPGLVNITLTTITCICLYQLYILRKTNNRLNTTITEMQDWVSQNQQLYYTQMTNDLQHQTFIISNKHFFFDSTVSYLVLRIQESNCDFCVEQQVQFMDSLQKTRPGYTLLVMCSFKIQESLTAFQTMNKPDLTYINVTEEQLHCRIDKLNIPYFFCLHNKLAYNYFFPDASYPIYTKKYFDNILHLYTQI